MTSEITEQNRYGLFCLLKVLQRMKTDVGADSRIFITLLIDVCEVVAKAIPKCEEIVTECERLMDAYGNEKLNFKSFETVLEIFGKYAQDTTHPNVEILCDEILTSSPEERSFINHLVYETDCTILRSLYSMNERRYTIMIGDVYTYKRIENYSCVDCGIIYRAGATYLFHPTLQTIINDPEFSVELFQEKFFPSSKSTTLEVSNFSYMKEKIESCVQILKSSKEQNSPTNIMFWGEPGTGKTELALILAKEAGLRPILIGEKDTTNGSAEDVSRHFRLSNLLIAQTLFKNDKNTLLIFDEMDDIIGNAFNRHSKITINRVMESNTLPILWIMNDPEKYLDKAVRRRILFNVKFEPFPSNVKKEIWREMANNSDVNLTDDDLTVIANRFEATPSIIKNVLRVHKDTGKDFVSVVRDNNEFLNFGETVKSYKEVDLAKYNFDYINPDSDVKNIGIKLFEKGRNFSLCLYGPPGTGKSEFAKYLAHMTNVEVLYKRASDLKDMYVGQTEKLIAAAFDEAEKEKKLLLIDEADTFIQNRSMLTHSHEKGFVNEMLSQMESRRVRLVMTTNIFEGVDDAAMRRFDFKIKFDYMKPEQVKLMFTNVFGVEPSNDILRLDNLTPADIMVVKEKVDLLDITEISEIQRLLKAESDYKNRHTSRKIGFTV